MSGSDTAGGSVSHEMEGWLKKKSPKTSDAKKMMDVWQRR